MAGYSRQSVADIIANAVIKAAPVNAEFNAIRDAFAFSGGHKHDGSSTEGAYIPLIADVDANNKVVVDTSNNRISFYVEVGGTAVEQLRIQDGAVVPVTDDDVDLGAVGAEFKDLYVDGIGYIDTIQIHENATITGNLTVNGNTTIGNSATDTVTVNADVASNLIPDADSTRSLGDSSNYWSHGYIDAVTTTGNATVGGNLSVTGTTALTGTATITSADINSGAMDNTTIGASTAAAGTFTNLTSTGTSTHATVDINGGAIDGTTIGSSSPAAITGTTITSTGLGTFPSVNIDGGAIDGTTIGATSAAAGSFTTVTTSGQATLASADINGGTIDGAVIGGSSAAAITGTTITANTGFTGSLTGNVTGNVTGNLTGNVTGNVTGDLTGNVTAASGSSTFNNVTINGGLDMNAGTTATITNLTDPTNAQDAATKGYVDTSIANVIDSAPAALDTLNELAAALGDDANFSTTVTNSIATKLPLAGGTMTGAIAMSTNKITGLGDPTANQDAATKVYVDTQRDTRLALSGGTMTGAINMGSNNITSVTDPVNPQDAATKNYIDTLFGSTTAAAASAAAAATSESNAATSETNAANSASAAATSEANAAASYDSFDDRYLGAKSSAPTLDNDGDALIIGALYFNTVANLMYVYSSSGWVPAGSSVNGTSDRVTYTATSGQTVFAATYDTGYVDVYLNGVKLVAGTDFTATNGTSITLATGATTGDVVDIVAYGTFVLADHYTEAQSDARFVNVTGDTMTGNLTIGGDLTVDTNTLYVDSTNNRVGIGTSSPISQLDLYNATTAKMTVRSGDGSAASVKLVRIAENDTSTDWEVKNANGTFKIIGDNTSQNEFSCLDIETLTTKFYTNNTERMRIDSSGNLLVGKTSLSTGSWPVSVSGGVTASSSDDSVRTQLFGWDGAAGVGTYTNTPFQFRINNSERMRIDTSGNLFVGKTSFSVATDGVMLIPDGYIVATQTSGYSGLFNRTSTDGEILRLQKDGSTVGSIGADGSALYLGTADTGIRFASGSDAFHPFNPSTLTDRDNAIDIGLAGIRFKDLYLSGKANVGTAVADTLTDTSNTGTVTLDFSAQQNFVLTLTGNVTLGNPTTESIGQSGFITFIQDATGGRTVSLGTDYETAGGAGLTLSSAANATDLVPYVVVASGRILLGAPQLAFA